MQEKKQVKRKQRQIKLSLARLCCNNKSALVKPCHLRVMRVETHSNRLLSYTKKPASLMQQQVN